MLATQQTMQLRAATTSVARVSSRPFQARSLPLRRGLALQVAAFKQQQPVEETSSPVEQLNHHMLIAAAALTPMLLGAEPALAQNRELGILEGTIFSLMHPAVMGGLFAASLYAAYLGFAWREVRTIPETVKELKLQLPAADAEGNRPFSEVQQRIDELEKKRKEMIGKKFNEKHNNVGSVLLGAGVLFSVSGAFNTFIRTGKLFPGPHLYAGAAITVLWALAASLVPSMQKGNKTARDAHIALNVLNLALFAWQVPTGLDIVGKVLQFTTLP